jgi:hypothetical protein
MIVNDLFENVAGPEKCWPGYRKVGTKPGTGRNAGKRVNDCEKIRESEGEFGIGDPVIITGAVEFQGKTGDVKAFNQDGSFVVVDLYNYGPRSFHISDVSRNDYADSEDELAEATPETTVSALRGYKTWHVWIKNNYYNGKYPDYSARPYRVIAGSADEARQVVLDNADRVLKDLLSKKFSNGKRVLPPRSALPVEAKHIGAVDDGTTKGQITTSKPITMLSPQGPMTVMLDAGNIVDVVQGVAEDIKQIDELSPEKLSDYKKKATKDSWRKIMQGDFKKGDKRLSGVVKATDRLTKDEAELEKGVAEVDAEKIGGRYDPEEFDDMMLRLKTLAGAGPLKTVWDPERRVYRNVPINPPQDKK